MYAWSLAYPAVHPQTDSDYLLPAGLSRSDATVCLYNCGEDVEQPPAKRIRVRLRPKYIKCSYIAPLGNHLESLYGLRLQGQWSLYGPFCGFHVGWCEGVYPELGLNPLHLCMSLEPPCKILFYMFYVQDSFQEPILPKEDNETKQLQLAERAQVANIIQRAQVSNN